MIKNKNVMWFLLFIMCVFFYSIFLIIFPIIYFIFTGNFYIFFNEESTLNEILINEIYLYEDNNDNYYDIDIHTDYYTNNLARLIDENDVIFNYDLKPFIKDNFIMNAIEEEIEIEIQISYLLLMEVELIKFVQNLKKEYCTKNFYNSVIEVLEVLDDTLIKQNKIKKKIQKELYKYISLNVKISNLWYFHEFHKYIFVKYYSYYVQKIDKYMGGSSYFLSRRIGMKLVQDMYNPIILNNQLECLGAWFTCIILLMKLMGRWGLAPTGGFHFPYDNWND